jgi:hypothetical protein
MIVFWLVDLRRPLPCPTVRLTAGVVDGAKEADLALSMACSVILSVWAEETLAAVLIGI